MEFRNELLRGYAYMHVPSPLRRALHGLIADRLIERGYSENRVEKIVGGNFLRLFREVWTGGPPA